MLKWQSYMCERSTGANIIHRYTLVRGKRVARTSRHPPTPCVGAVRRAGHVGAASSVLRLKNLPAHTNYCVSGIAMYAIVSTVEIATDAPLKAFTLSRIFCATDLSSISRRPVPSTSQTPACAMFHKPVASLPLKPRPRKRGTAITARCAGGAPVASWTAAMSAHAIPNAVPAFPRLARSSASMLVRLHAACARKSACSSSVVVTLEASTSSLNTPHLMRLTPPPG
mmetsp:Transcript_6359/g.26360  ORF Transcript_6359/g.26360 Transcript_6359/m.26360 type:complete len:226 (+) Transcript_6359:2215-2892(+)